MGEMCSVVLGNCFCVVIFGNCIVLRWFFLFLEELFMFVIYLMNEKLGNMVNCLIKFYNFERKYSSVSVKRLFFIVMFLK